MFPTLRAIANANYKVVRGPYPIHDTDSLGITTRNLHAGNDVQRTSLALEQEQPEGGVKTVFFSTVTNTNGVTWLAAIDDTDCDEQNHSCGIFGIKPVVKEKSDGEVEVIPCEAEILEAAQ